MRIGRKLVGIAAAFVLALTGILGVSAPAFAASNLGGVNIAAACSDQLFIAPGPGIAVLIANNVSGWRCRYVGGVLSFTYTGYSIDLNRECRREYGGGAWAGYLNFNDPYSWRCWR